MAKYDGVRVVQVGGRKSVAQSYAGTVGGQSLDYANIDTEIKAGWTFIKSRPELMPSFLSVDWFEVGSIGASRFVGSRLICKRSGNDGHQPNE